MKAVSKGAQPADLTAYFAANPTHTWDQMKGDSGLGDKAAKDCRKTAISDQGGICAYCEIDIHDDPFGLCRVEHFHPKSDRSTPHNWGLDWANMLATCSGGTYPHTTRPGHFLEPIRDNQSCDAIKGDGIYDGWILDPSKIPPAPCLFRIDNNGFLAPNPDTCATVTIPGNRHIDTERMVRHTIETLNLNCDRLSKSRRAVFRNIEELKKEKRLQGLSANQVNSDLCDWYFRQRWPAYFTTIRIALREWAEAHLNARADFP